MIFDSFFDALNKTTIKIFAILLQLNKFVMGIKFLVKLAGIGTLYPSIKKDTLYYMHSVFSPEDASYLRQRRTRGIRNFRCCITLKSFATLFLFLLHFLHFIVNSSSGSLLPFFVLMHTCNTISFSNPLITSLSCMRLFICFESLSFH